MNKILKQICVGIKVNQLTLNHPGFTFFATYMSSKTKKSIPKHALHCEHKMSISESCYPVLVPIISKK